MIRGPLCFGNRLAETLNSFVLRSVDNRRHGDGDSISNASQRSGKSAPVDPISRGGCSLLQEASVCVFVCAGVRPWANVRGIEPESNLVDVQRRGTLQLCVSTIFHSHNPISNFARMSHVGTGTCLALKFPAQFHASSYFLNT